MDAPSELCANAAAGKANTIEQSRTNRTIGVAFIGFSPSRSNINVYVLTGKDGDFTCGQAFMRSISSHHVRM
jgi:hypothetical protein